MIYPKPYSIYLRGTLSPKKPQLLCGARGLIPGEVFSRALSEKMLSGPQGLAFKASAF